MIKNVLYYGKDNVMVGIYSREHCNIINYIPNTPYDMTHHKNLI